jgi:hypothetical protein
MDSKLILKSASYFHDFVILEQETRKIQKITFLELK